MPITVQLTGPDGASRSRAWALESVLVGSGPEAAVRVDDPDVSSAHCLLKVEGTGRVVLIDLGSDSGTRVDGRRIQAPVRLQSGQRFELGRSSVRVHWPADQEPTATGAGPPGEQAWRLQAAVAFGGVAVAVREVSGGIITAGEGPGCDLFAAHPALGARTPVAELRAGEARVRLPPGVPVLLEGPGPRQDRAALLAAGRLAEDTLVLAAGERLRLELGAQVLTVRRVPTPPPVPTEVLTDQDFDFARLVVAALLIFLALATAAALTPGPGWGQGEDYVTPARYVRLVVPPARPPELGLKRLDPARSRERLPRRAADAHPAERPAARRPGGPAAPKAEVDRQKVTHLLAGLLGGAPGAGPFAGGLAPQVTDALGGLRAPGGAADLGGLGGLGSRGRGGSGAGGAGLGLGGAVGPGGGAPGVLDLGGGPPPETVRVVPGKTVVVGGLDREVIARVIERHQAEIKFCYEAALQREPGLAGKVAVAWTIDPAGAVAEASVSESTLGSAAVERCIVDRVRRWRFPAPQGGGVVEVSFPWIFKSAGDGVPAPSTGGGP